VQLADRTFILSKGVFLRNIALSFYPRHSRGFFTYNTKKVALNKQLFLY